MYFGVRNKCLQLLGCLGLVDSPLNKDGEVLVMSVSYIKLNIKVNECCGLTVSSQNNTHEATQCGRENE